MPNSKDITELPQHFLDNYTEISLYIDFMYANSIMFLVNASKHVGFV